MALFYLCHHTEHLPRTILSILEAFFIFILFETSSKAYIYKG